jgi:hypothetical protein
MVSTVATRSLVPFAEAPYVHRTYRGGANRELRETPVTGQKTESSASGTSTGTESSASGTSIGTEAVASRP